MGRSRWRRTRVRQDAGDWQETAPAFRTMELLVVIVVALGLLATAARDHTLSAFQVWMLLTALAIGYLLSRGLARSGVPWRRDTTTTDYHQAPPSASPTARDQPPAGTAARRAAEAPLERAPAGDQGVDQDEEGNDE